MITKINEFKQHLRLNEGGGAGISFTMNNMAVDAVYTLTKDTITKVSSETTLAPFDAHGYDDGMSNIDPKVLKVADLTLTLENALKLSFDNEVFKEILSDVIGFDESVLQESYDVRTIAELLTMNETLNIKLTFELSNIGMKGMIFRGWVRGEVKEDMVLMTPNNIEYFYITAEINGVAYEIDSYDISAIELGVVPAVLANAEFINFYKDIFDYDLEEDAKYTTYQEVMDDDKYDSDLEEYMLNKKITISIDAYKKSLENETQLLPDELYIYIQNKRDVEEDVNDQHWQDVQANWGAHN